MRIAQERGDARSLAVALWWLARLTRDDLGRDASRRLLLRCHASLWRSWASGSRGDALATLADLELAEYYATMPPAPRALPPSGASGGEGASARWPVAADASRRQRRRPRAHDTTPTRPPRRRWRRRSRRRGTSFAPRCRRRPRRTRSRSLAPPSGERAARRVSRRSIVSTLSIRRCSRWRRRRRVARCSHRSRRRSTASRAPCWRSRRTPISARRSSARSLVVRFADCSFLFFRRRPALLRRKMPTR